jgi:glycosyltransferase involved in cell wall biosynthesis
VHQLLAALSYGDAIGNEALALQRLLRDAGFESEIFAEAAHPRLAHRAHALECYAAASAADTVCLFHFAVGSAAGPLILRAPDRLVVVYHNITPAESFLGFQHHLLGLCYHGRRQLAAFAERAALALGDSEYNRRELEQAGYRRTAVLPIMPDLESRRAPSRVVGRLYRDGRTNVLCVGRVMPNKRLEDVVRAFAVFQRRLRPRSRLLLVGDTLACPHYADRLRELAGELRVRDVVLAGHVDDDELAAYYGLADALVSLSEHEGFCVPLLEAMAAGVPVLACDAGAVAETMGGAGVLLKERHPELVAELLALLSADGPLRAAVLAGQARRIAGLRALDYRALLLERLAPVLETPACA